MKPFLATLILAALLASGMGRAAAEDEMIDSLSRSIWTMYQMRKGKTLCLAEATPLAAVRHRVVQELRSMGEFYDPPNHAVAKALWTLYPCPFSPYRPELRPATEADIEGAWFLPEGSRKLFPEKAGPALKCRALAYYHGGEMRHAEAADHAPCPFETADDLEAVAGRQPWAKWILLREGRIGIRRSDIPDHVEEWDVFAVFAPFEVDGVAFQAGDLVAYDRRGKNNEFNLVTRFRHLKRLP